MKKSLSKTREFGKTSNKLPSRNISRKHRRAKKDYANDKNMDENVMDYDKDNDITEDIIDRIEEMNDDVGDSYDKALDSDEDYDEPTDKANSDSESREITNDTESVSLLTKYTSDLSNPSSPASECKSVDDPFDEDYMESPETTQESQVTSASEAASDLSNEATDVPAMSSVSPESSQQCENIELSEKTAHLRTMNVDAEKEVYGENIKEVDAENIKYSPKRTACGSTQGGEDVCNDGNKRTNEEECSNNVDQRISANNLEVDADGKSVIWTRYELTFKRTFSSFLYANMRKEESFSLRVSFRSFRHMFRFVHFQSL